MPSSIVLDADVMRSAGKVESEAERCILARKILSEISGNQTLSLDVCNHLGLEYIRNASEHSLAWFRKMRDTARVNWHSSEQLPEVRNGILQLRDPSWHQPTAKDAHLVELSIRTGASIFSMDDKARRFFAVLATIVPTIASVAWVSCTRDAPNAVTILMQTDLAVIQGMYAQHKLGLIDQAAVASD